jgi:DNA end-binding protein Ku
MPVVARAYWKGFLRLSLVTVNVEIYPAIDTSADISFRQIHKPSGQRVRYQKVVPGVGEVESSDIVKGFEIDDDTYVLVEPDEVRALQLESERALDLVQFIDADEIDARYFERPYYVLPADEPSTDGYRVIAAALAAAGKVGLGQVTMRGREYLVAIAPIEDARGLLMEILHYAREIRPAKAFFDELPETKVDKEMVSLATELIARKTAAFDPGAFHDRYAAALRALVEEKAKGRKIVTTTAEELPPSAEVIDLMEALKKSVSGSAGKKRAIKARKPTSGASSGSGGRAKSRKSAG